MIALTLIIRRMDIDIAAGCFWILLFGVLHIWLLLLLLFLMLLLFLFTRSSISSVGHCLSHQGIIRALGRIDRGPTNNRCDSKLHIFLVLLGQTFHPRVSFRRLRIILIILGGPIHR
jgi:hypothetical protein